MIKTFKIVALLTLISVLLPLDGFPQQIPLMNEMVEKNPDSGSWGPNKTNYLELRLLYAFANKWEEYSYPLKFFGTGEFETMVRYKLKLNSLFSTGVSAGYLNQHYVVDIDSRRGENMSDREVFKINSIKPAVFLRLNIDPKRGNYVGKYLETGLYGSWSFSNKKVIVNTYEGEDEPGFRKSREIQTGLSNLNRVNYGAYISIGVGNYEISYRHRMTRIIDDKLMSVDPRIDYIIFDFPRNTLALSIRIGL